MVLPNDGRQLSVRSRSPRHHKASSVGVIIELIQAGSEQSIQCEVARNATIGDVVASFKKAAFDKFNSNDLFNSYTNGAVALIIPGSSPQIFKLSHVDAEVMKTQERGDVGSIKTLRFQLLRHSKSWVIPWNGTTFPWAEPISYLPDIMMAIATVKHEFPKLVMYNRVHVRVRELPWIRIAMEIANNVHRTSVLLSSAQAIMEKPLLQYYLQAWMNENDVVRRIISWNLFRTEDVAKKMAMLSTPGGYLASLMLSFVSIERKRSKPSCNMYGIYNDVYVQLATDLKIHYPVHVQRHHIGNAMESLLWYAYEQDRYEFIISVIHHAADLQWALRHSSVSKWSETETDTEDTSSHM